MKGIYLTVEKIEGYRHRLIAEEKSPATVERYLQGIRMLREWLPGQGRLDKEVLLAWKRELAEKYAASTVNILLAAVNGYLCYENCPQYRVKPLKIQRRIFRDKERELTKAEYLCLIETARREGHERLALIMQTLGSTGIRVSELRFITREAVEKGEAVVDCKGKQRPVLLSRELRKVLLVWCKKRGVDAGPVFVTSGGRPVDRCNLSREMKRLCQRAGVDRRKVFPHNFRHLFAVLFYEVSKDIAKLADLLGHASINTTRIYIMGSGHAHRRLIERLGLVV